MRTIAVLPVKSLGRAKQRLASQLGSGSRRALALAMLSDVLASLRRVSALDSIVVVTADRTAESAALGTRVGVLRERDEAGQSRAALVGIRHALKSGFERVLLVPGDTPLLDAGELSALLDRTRELAVVVVPDRHGRGTNALLMSPPGAIQPSFGPGSLERHVAAAQAVGVTHAVDEVPSLALDVDTPEDLAELDSQLHGRVGSAPMTRGTLRQLHRSQARGHVRAKEPAAALRA